MASGGLTLTTISPAAAIPTLNNSPKAEPINSFFNMQYPPFLIIIHKEPAAIRKVMGIKEK
jgi:hypothetical protein